MVERDDKVSYHRKRKRKFSLAFKVEGLLRYCTIEKLLRTLSVVYIVNEWKSFNDSSKRGLKAVLLHVANKRLSISIAYSSQIKESY